MRDEDGSGGELEEGGQGGLDARGVADHRVGDAGQDGDEGRDRVAGIDERLELPEHLTTPHFDRAEFGDAALLRRAAGGLEVDDDEGHVGQRGAQVLEGALDHPHASEHMSRV